MSTLTNRRIVLASRPEKHVGAENFRLEEIPVPDLAGGEVLVRNHFLSLDPYMRGRMNAGKSYAPPQAIGETMIGATVGEVIDSKSPGFAKGDRVLGMLGWQNYGVYSAAKKMMLAKIDTTQVPISAYLGAAGMPGITAWYGLNKIIAPKENQTVCVSAAAGAVGSVVGQLAKRMGCRVIGIAGGAEKCAHVTRDLGFDACVDYKAGKLDDDLRAAAPNGIDGSFENVGGDVMDATLRRMNAFGRIALCGMISGYDGEPSVLKSAALLLVSRLRLEGFIVSEHMEFWAEATKELASLVAQKKLVFRETIANGLESAPEAFMGLLKGKNTGKQLVSLL